ncbi:uncharacterized protein LOC122394010 [Amphibalanus amphitrite]|uniref:uncharacterized protein LOC122394010 n=1 Tax=Amphibalanus amphitrite TaxID=1232801 RepID=UPI001C914D93|nr:uncharacterized protein LOC122394010 [Amphibalanus amphitrite]
MPPPAQPERPEAAAQDAPTRPFASFRIQAYAPEEGELWLVQVECAFAVAGISDDGDKFRLLVANLPVHMASQVRDVVTAETGSFTDLKRALSTRLAQSRASRPEALLRDHQLGDRKPTQLLHSMQHMLGSAGHDLGLLRGRTLFFQRLPPTIRSALALMPEDTGNEDLASAADRFQEASGGAAVTAVCTPTAGVAAACGPPAGPRVMLAPPASAVAATGPPAACGCGNSGMAAAVTALTAAVARIEAVFQRGGAGAPPRGRSRSRPRRPAPASSGGSQPASVSSAEGYCWYHQKYGAEAHHCRPPCSWAEN